MSDNSILLQSRFNYALKELGKGRIGLDDFNRVLSSVQAACSELKIGFYGEVFPSISELEGYLMRLIIQANNQLGTATLLDIELSCETQNLSFAKLNGLVKSGLWKPLISNPYTSKFSDDIRFPNVKVGDFFTTEGTVGFCTGGDSFDDWEEVVKIDGDKIYLKDFQRAADFYSAKTGKHNDRTYELCRFKSQTK